MVSSIKTQCLLDFCSLKQKAWQQAGLWCYSRASKVTYSLCLTTAGRGALVLVGREGESAGNVEDEAWQR